jgi:hypothetical protein
MERTDLVTLKKYMRLLDFYNPSLTPGGKKLKPKVETNVELLRPCSKTRDK